MRKLIILFVFLPFLASAQVKISALPEATSVGSSDLFILNQSGTTKKLPYSLLQGTYVSTTVFNDTVSALKNRTIWGLNANSTGTGSRKVLIGESAGLATTENNLIGIGYNAFYNASSTSLDYGIAIGMNAGYGASGLSNFFGGYNSGHSNTGNYSTLLGSFSGRSNTNGQLTAIGYYSGYYNTGSNATGIGSYSNYRNTGTYTTSLGSYAGYYTSGAGISGNNNTFVGYYATSSAPAVINSTAIGANATVSLDSTVVLGNNADTYVTKDLYLTGNFSSLGDSVYLLSDLSGQDAKFDTLQADYFIGAAIVAGSNTQIQYNDNGSSGASENLAFDGITLTLEADSGSHNVLIGKGAGNSILSSNDGNTFTGWGAGYSTISSFNVFVGDQAGYSNTTGFNNVFVGYRSGISNTTGNFNTFLGYRSGTNNTEGYENLILGHAAGFNNTTGYRNVFVGHNSGFTNTIGANNIFLGYQAGYNETGSNKLYIENSNSASPLIWGDFANDTVRINGYLDVTGAISGQSGISAAGNDTEIQYNDGGALGANSNFAFDGKTLNLESGSNSIFVGQGAGLNSTSSLSNVFLGGNSGYTLTGSGYNTLVGAQSFLNASSGSRNTILGYQAGSASGSNISDNIFVGHKAGGQETGSNKLYVAVTNTTSPLIYGEFDNDYLKFNADSSTFAGTIKTEQIYAKTKAHGFFAFEDSAVVIDCVVDTWVQVTNATNDLFTGIQEGEGFDISGDTITFNETAQSDLHPHIVIHWGVDGFAGANEDYEIRLYNIDNISGVVRKAEGTTTGANNRISIGTTSYDVSSSFGDRYIIQINNKTNSNDFTVENGSILIKVSHY